MKCQELGGIYRPSDDIVAREIAGELILVPLTAGFGDMEDEIFTLNETGKAIWRLLDGHRDLSDIVHTLAEDFDASIQNIAGDVHGLVTELLRRGMLVEVTCD